MFEVKFVVNDKIFETEEDANYYIKKAQEELVEEKFKSMVLAKLDIPFSDPYGDVDIFVIKMNNTEDYQSLLNWYDKHYCFAENYMEDPVVYPCTKVFIAGESYVEFGGYELSDLIHKFAVATSVLANINRMKKEK